ncbi:IclR family transcriptional regulator [Rhodobacteraceae bacterium F11138]|nr:IclR family transcriptional regulator [Rhodobacteraceae bacterium F11138]
MNDDELARLSKQADHRLILQSVVRALRAQEAVGLAGRALSLTEIAQAIGVNRSSAQRLAHTLEAMGYLERADNGNGFRPGQQVLDRGFEYLRTHPLVERATPVLTELRKSARERVDLSLFDGTTIIYAIRLQSKRETFFATLIGRRIPTFCTSGGRAVMSQLPMSEVEDILDKSDLNARTPRTITDRAAIIEQVMRAREDGYALVMEESLMGEVALGAAIKGTDGRPKAAVHIAGSLSEWSEPSFRERFAPLAMETAAMLSR